MATAERRITSRPETVRTKLARFMPMGKMTERWSVTWSAQTRRRDAVPGPEEVRTADHLGCFGAALSHALAQAGAPAAGLRLIATALPGTDDKPGGIEVEIQGLAPELDQADFETIIRRADPSCPVWNSLARSVEVRIKPVLVEHFETEATAPAGHAPAPAAASAPAPAPAEAAPVLALPRLSIQLPGAPPRLLLGGLAGAALLGAVLANAPFFH